MKKQLWKVYWPKEGWRSVAKGKECCSTLCKAIRERWCSINIGIGAPGSKTPKNVKNSKIAVQFRQLGWV
jgi:hypothetical protein